MEKKYLSDCIRYTTDIAPYPFIQIYSGVGSGKNTFVDALAKGYEESQWECSYRPGTGTRDGIIYPVQFRP